MRANDKYILGGLDGHTPVECPDLLEWARWFETHDRRVKQEFIGPYQVSTVFLGLDHNWSALIQGVQEAAPILFETMVFNKIGYSDELTVQERCSTWDEAIEQHDRIAAEIRKAVIG